MSWKDLFKKAISSFQADDLENSLTYFNKAIELDGSQYIMYDSRAAVYDRLGRPNDALRDAKKAIDIAPSQWQGYARSSRVFLKVHKYDAAFLMVDLALDRLKADDTTRRAELVGLKDQALRMRAAAMEHERRLASEVAYHFGMLPLEICVEIYREATLSDPGQVVVLSLVCRHWRTVVLNTPSLWSTLVLSDKNPAGKTKKWAERSKGTIRELILRRALLNDWKFSLNELNCSQWDALRSCRDETGNFFPYLEHNSLTHVLPNLTKLEVTHGRRLYDGSCIVDKLLNANLRYLALDGQPFSWDTLATHFTQLVSLAVRPCGRSSFKSLLATLKANPNLENLVLEFSDCPAREIYSPFCLPLLTRLEFGGVGMDFNIFDYVSVPSLQKLRFYRGTASNFWWTPWPFLSELRIQSCYLNVVGLPDFLRTTPVLYTLEISNLVEGANKVVEALATPLPPLHVVNDVSSCDSAAVPASPTYLCPRLAHVDFSHCPDIKTGALLRLVKSRLGPVATLAEVGNEARTSLLAQIESIVVDGCPQVEGSALPWLRTKVRTVSCIYMSKKDASWKR